MYTVVALEELIKQEEARVNFERKQLAAHESGDAKLTRVALASTEAKLEESQELLTKHKAMLEELLQEDQKELEEKARLEEAIKRKKYFDEQNMRVQNAHQRGDDEKLEAMMIIDELPENVKFEDDKIFEIAAMSLDLDLRAHKELKEKLEIIKADFKNLIKKSKDDKVAELELLDVRIPILILHFSVLLEVFKENFIIKEEEEEKPTSNEEESKENTEESETKDETIEEPKEEQKKEIKTSFSGFPKYEDWWVSELWSSHQAYFALYKWKAIIANFCKTGEQLRSWNKVFDNWIFVKKLLNDKGSVAYEYHYAFDSLITEYAELEEELEDRNLESMETIIKRITNQEDFTKVMKNHNIKTEYLQYKKKRLGLSK